MPFAADALRICVNALETIIAGRHGGNVECGLRNEDLAAGNRQ
jgi:hypothetical protein